MINELELRCLCDMPKCSIILRYEKDGEFFEFFSRIYHGRIWERIKRAWKILRSDYDEDFMDSTLEGEDTVQKMLTFLNEIKNG